MAKPALPVDELHILEYMGNRNWTLWVIRRKRREVLGGRLERWGWICMKFSAY